MKRKYLTIITGFVLSFSLLSFPVYAADEPVQPEIPIEQTEESITEYNSQVDEYNLQVDEYNKEIDSTYEQQVKEYNETIEYNNQEEQSVNDYNALETEKVDTHNQEEDEKVIQNQLDIEQYEEDLKQYEEDIVKYEEDLEQYEKDKKQYEADLKNENTVKTYYGAESVEDYNMKIFKTPDEEEYNEVLEQAVDRRVVREENAALKDKEYSSTITKEEEEEKPIIPSEELEPRAPVQSSYNPVPQTVEVPDPIPEGTAAAYYVTIKEKEFPKAAPKVILPLKAKSVTTQQEIINDDPVPLSMSYSSTSYWALLNLLLTILTVIEVICLAISYICRYEKDKEENNTENKYNYYPIRRLIQIGITFITILVFIYTEDITLPMRFVDKYTIIMILLALVSTIFMILSKRKKEEDTQGE